MSIMVTGMSGRSITPIRGLTIIQMGIIHFLLDNSRSRIQESPPPKFGDIGETPVSERVIYA
jgi:hypothetical protein